MSNPAEVTREVHELLRKKRDMKKDRIQSADYRQKEFEERTAKLIEKVQGWFKPFSSYEVEAVVSEATASCDFGLGDVDATVKRLEVHSEDNGVILTVSGYYPGYSVAERGVFFAECPVNGKADLVFWPEPMSREYEPDWYVRKVSESSSVGPEYRKFDEQLVMTWFKSILTKEESA